MDSIKKTGPGAPSGNTRLPGAPTVISLFAGCGGSSQGYSMAGFRELLAVERDDHAVETFKLNFPGVPVWQGDIANQKWDEDDQGFKITAPTRP